MKSHKYHSNILGATKIVLLISLLLGSITVGFASSTNEAWENLNQHRDATINVYAVGAKIDKNQHSSTGIGVMFDSEAVKVKVEGTNDFFKTGAVLKVNPFNPNLYFKFGLNYINQKVWSPLNTNTRVNQYSSAFATGYMLQESLYLEAGAAYTKLNGTVFGDYEIKDEATSLAYLELAKRWDSSIGTVDTTLNIGRVNHEHRDNTASYGTGVDYYPFNDIKLSYIYQYEKKNISNLYKAQYSFVFVDYKDNISNDTYNLTVGLSVAFDDIFDLSTYKAPTNIKSHLSELHAFENITFINNMEIQSSAGVQKSEAAVARDAISTLTISTPTIFIANYTIDTGFPILHIPTVTNVQAGAVYSIVADPTAGNLTINSSNGALLWIWNGTATGSRLTITVKVVNPDGGTASTTFTIALY